MDALNVVANSQKLHPTSEKKLTNAYALVILCSRFNFIGDPTIDTMFVSNRISEHQTGAGAKTSVVQLLRKRTITP